MRTLVVGAIIGWLAAAAPSQAQVTTLPSTAPVGTDPAPAAGTASLVSGPAVFSDEPADGPPTRLWVQGEYLLWWVSGNRLPPLITTSPAGTPAPAAGVPGTPGTEVLFGNADVNDKARSGGRLTAGYWFDDEQTWGIEASFFMLEGQTHGLAAGSGGEPILARPFFNTATGVPDAELVAFPGILSGTVTASSASDSLLGAEVLVRRNLVSVPWGGDRSGLRLDALAGYRFLHLEEHLSVQENLTVTATNAMVPPGTSIIVNDRFDTENNFHGGELGLAAELDSGPWSLNLLGKLALGGTASTVDINGSTAVTEPGMATSVQAGGLLALGSNSGSHEGTHFSLVPELDVNLGYQLTDNWRITAGYTLLYWTETARPGEQVDLAVNPNQLPPPVPGGAQRPAFPFQRSTLCAQGLSVGISFRY